MVGGLCSSNSLYVDGRTHSAPLVIQIPFIKHFHRPKHTYQVAQFLEISNLELRARTDAVYTRFTSLFLSDVFID
jgi:hypothetical protein